MALVLRAGAVLAAVPMSQLNIISGEEVLSEYQFNTKTARHYFCSVCGIYTHHQRRSNPEQFGFNIACLDGVNMAEIGDVPWGDGINHPNDR